MMSDFSPELTGAQVTVLRELRDHGAKAFGQLPEHVRPEVPRLLHLKYLRSDGPKLHVTERGTTVLAEHEARQPDQVGGTVDRVTGRWTGVRRIGKVAGPEARPAAAPSLRAAEREVRRRHGHGGQVPGGPGSGV
jgi:hypothetical protein